MIARRLALAAGVALCVLVCVFVIGVAPVAAAPIFGEPGQGSGQIAFHSFGLGVDQATGELYVSDEQNNRVDKFDGSGDFLLAWGWDVNEASPASELQTCTTECQEGGEDGVGAVFSPQGLAVDNDLSSSSYGDVYVDDFDNYRVEKFSSSGEFLLMFGGEVNTAKDSTPGATDAERDVCVAGEACGKGVAGSSDGSFEGAYEASNVAVGPSGRVYVGDKARVQVFEPSGVWRENISLAGLSSEGKVKALAVDAAGDVFVSDEGVTGVRELEPDGTEKGFQFDAGSASVGTIAIDESGHLFVTESSEGVHILEFEAASGKELESFGWGTLTNAEAMVFVNALGGLYVYGDNAGIWLFTPPPAGPLVESGSWSATPGLRGAATFEALVDPEGEETSYHFEYVTAAQYQNNGFAGASSTSGMTIGSSTDFTDHTVNAPLTGLVPGMTYDYRAVAANGHGTATGADQVFTETPPAQVNGPWVANVADTSATFAAEIDPLGASTSYRIEYGTSTSYGSTLAGSAGEGSSYVPVSFHIQNLAPDSSYHYRVVTVNEVGTVEGSDHTFTTQVAGGNELALLDGRAWELVSPTDKRGALIEPFTRYNLIQAASNGSGIFYPVSEPVGEGGKGRVVTAPTLSVRGPNGWSSEDLTLPYDLPEDGVAVRVDAETYKNEYPLLSSDLSLAAVEPLDVGGVTLSDQATERTLYLRDSINGSFLPLVTPAEVPPGTKFGGEYVSGVGLGQLTYMKFLMGTPDLSHVIFESPLALTPGAPSSATQNLYEWSAGRLQLVDILPDGKTGAFPLALLGINSDMVAHAISNDGHRILWSEGIFGLPKTRVYVRDTVEERTLQVGGTHVGFSMMDSDGSRVFFLENGDLYELDVDTGVQVDLTADHIEGEGNAGVQSGVLGASEDGSYVYFVATGVLASGAVNGEDNLYVSHYDGRDWVTTHIATLSNEDENSWFARGIGSGDEADYLGWVSSRVSPDGRYVAFMSNRSLTGYDNIDAVSGQPDEEVYLYDAETARLACASCDPTGARPVGLFNPGEGTGLPLVLHASGAHWWSRHWLAGSIPGWRGYEEGGGAVYQPRYLSDSGRLFFESPDALVPQDTNGVEDVYEYEPAGVGGCSTSVVTFSERSDGCVDLISSGTSSGESVFYDASENGDDAFFITASKLVSQDTDESYDVYDAHVCSLAVPCVSSPVSPPECTTGDSCKAAPSPQPEIFGAAPSATFSGTGNVIEEAKKSTPKTKKPKKSKKSKKKAKQRKHKGKRARRSSTGTSGKGHR